MRRPPTNYDTCGWEEPLPAAWYKPADQRIGPCLPTPEPTKDPPHRLCALPRAQSVQRRNHPGSRLKDQTLDLGHMWQHASSGHSRAAHARLHVHCCPGMSMLRRRLSHQRSAFATGCFRAHGSRRGERSKHRQIARETEQRPQWVHTHTHTPRCAASSCRLDCARVGA